MTIPNLERYRQGDFVQYMNNVLEVLTPARTAAFNITPQRETLQTIMGQLSAAWQPELGSELTPEIVVLDQQRDSVFTGLKLTVDNWGANHYDPLWRNAAFIIADNIAGHGSKITVMRYQQQTATINAILQDLNGELSGHVGTLGLAGWLTQLSTLNTAFNQKYVERAQAVSGSQPGLIIELIGTVTTAFRQLKTLFEARFAIAVADAAPVTEFQQVENELNTITQQYNDAVNRYIYEETDEQPEDNPPA